MPAIAASYGASETAVQATITAYFIAFGLGQLFYGPWADQAGRKLPIMVGLVLFLIASFGAAFAPTMAALTGWRALQGLGGAVLMVVPRAIIRDQYTGTQATRLMAMLMLVQQLLVLRRVRLLLLMELLVLVLLLPVVLVLVAHHREN